METIKCQKINIFEIRLKKGLDSIRDHQSKVERDLKDLLRRGRQTKTNGVNNTKVRLALIIIEFTWLFQEQFFAASNDAPYRTPLMPQTCLSMRENT